MTTDAWGRHPHEPIADYRARVHGALTEHLAAAQQCRHSDYRAIKNALHIADCQLTQIRDALTRASGPDAPPCAITVQTIRLIAGEATAPVVIPGHDAHVTEALKALIPSQVGHDSQIDEDIA